MEHKMMLFLTHKEEDNVATIEQMCMDEGITLAKVYKLADMIDASFSYRYETLLIDLNLFSVNEDLLMLFRKKRTYIPNIILLTNKRLNFNTIKNVHTCPHLDFNKLKDVLKECFENEDCEFVSPHNTNMRQIVNKELLEMGFNQKYKGYNYLVDIVYKSIVTGGLSRSFKRVVYPFIASLYSVSPISVERDVRNILTLSVKNPEFAKRINFDDTQNKPTIKNILNPLILYTQKCISS